MNTLSFFNLLDAESKISITNVAVYVCLLKLIISPSASITEAGTLMLALANYGHKRALSSKKTNNPEIEQLTARMDEMTATVSGLSLQSGIKRN